MYIISGKKEQRAMHWRDIQSRVTTHEGEFLQGKAGVEYQKKWSKKYLGRDLGSAPQADTRMVEQHEAMKQKNK